jgi:hypothetical protein
MGYVSNNNYKLVNKSFMIKCPYLTLSYLYYHVNKFCLSFLSVQI